MKRLSNFLTTNPAIVVAMFMLTVASGVAGLLLSWELLYRDYLSKSVSIPAWLVLAVVFGGFFGWILYGTRAKKAAPEKAQLISDKSFGVERVKICGKIFVGCRFQRTELVYDGMGSVGIKQCSFEIPKISFDGPAALTVDFLTQMYADPTFRPFVDSLMVGIKNGAHPMSIPPSGQTATR
ncbi:hypothetical protein [Pseudomonas plecoglossicida]|uniref:hypothetical protein n=1 Tax=Pseudomonas plecoglossicida TaxID=70775 RepID=UPI003D23E0AD